MTHAPLRCDCVSYVFEVTASLRMSTIRTDYLSYTVTGSTLIRKQPASGPHTPDISTNLRTTAPAIDFAPVMTSLSDVIPPSFLPTVETICAP